MADTVIEVLMKFTDEISSGLDSVQTKIDGFSGSAEKAASAFLPMSTAAAAAGAAALKMGVDFDTSVGKIERTAGLSTAELDKMTESALKLAPSLSVLPKEYLDLASAMSQLGMEKDSLEGVTQAVIMLGQATETPSAKWEDMGRKVASVAAIFKQSEQDTKDFVASVNYVDANIGSTSANILEFTTRVGSLAEAVKMSANDVTVFAGTFGKLGIDADKGATAFNGMLTTLASIDTQSKTSQEAFKNLGIEADQMAQMINENPSKAIMFFLEKLNETELPLNEVVANMQQAFGKGNYDEIMTLATGTEDLKRGLEGVADATENWNTMQENNKEMLATTEQQMKILAATLQSIAVQIGSAMLPALNQLLQGILPLVEAFNGLMTAHPILAQIVAGFIAITAAVAPVLAAVGAVASGIAAVGASITAILPMIAAVGAAIAAVVAAILASPALIVAAIVAALALIVAAIVLNWDKIKEVCQQGMDFIKDIVDKGIELLKTSFTTAFDAIKGVFEKGMELVKTVVEKGLDLVKTVIEKGMEMIKGVIDKIITAIIELFKKLVTEAGNAGKEMMVQMAKGINDNKHLVTDAVKSATQSAGDYIPQSPAKKGALSNIDRAGFGLMNSIAQGIKGYDLDSVMNQATSGLSLGGSSDAGLMGGAGAGSNITINYNPIIQARDDKDLMQQLRNNQREVVRLLHDAQSQITRRIY